ncbi:MAG: hypothetical protein ACTSU2_03745 [Promethearchaeota archaeon]
MYIRIPKLEGVPALIYSAVWPLWVDGRLKAVSKGMKLKILFKFKDFLPSALLKIDNGEFRVISIDEVYFLLFSYSLLMPF